MTTTGTPTTPPLSSARLPDDEFAAQRRAVLRTWTTGEQVDLDEAVAYHRRTPPLWNQPRRLAAAAAAGELLIEPRAGVAVLEDHIALLRYLRDEGRADLLPSSVDSYTRNLRFAQAAEAVEESRKIGRSLLNGFPVAVHGVPGCRRVLEAVERPLDLKCNSPDARFTCEVAFAGGFTGQISGAITTTMNYAKDVDLARAIRQWQYVDRLVAEYEARGVPILREIQGVVQASSVPPSLVLSSVTIETILAAMQGARNFGVEWFMCGHLPLDIAMLRLYPTIVRRYLERLGLADGVNVWVVANHWSGAFPENPYEAIALISLNTVAAVFGRSTKLMTKSLDQGVALPTKENNAAGLRTTKTLIQYLASQPALESERIEEEKDILAEEACAIIDRILELGDGDAAVGIVRAIDAGVFEAPFSSSRLNLNEVMIVRDREGAPRFWKTGHLPLPERVRKYHREKVAERERAEGRPADYKMVVDSVMAISRGSLV
jgi:methylaspartate mutase epsilon subunit